MLLLLQPQGQIAFDVMGRLPISWILVLTIHPTQQLVIIHTRNIVTQLMTELVKFTSTRVRFVDGLQNTAMRSLDLVSDLYHDMNQILRVAAISRIN